MSGCAGSEPFALQVLGDSMEPEFRDGAIVIVEPGVVVDDGCYVVAQHNEEYVLRQLNIHEQRWYLKPLNEDYETVEISGLDTIRGRVIQRTGRRRSERKSYL
ncbi:MAG: S24 family peptidase [Gammaproteobacteria bacterium]|nr:S24 family peptidase [Gammaproteobacteria bacterium]